MVQTLMTLEDLIKTRREFIASCSKQTQEIHNPIIDPGKTKGCINPAGLGDAAEFSSGPGLAWGQSTIAFIKTEDFDIADNGGDGYEGSAEYGVIRTADSAAFCKKIAALHNGTGAVLLPSGLAAVTTALMSFPQDRTQVVLIPESIYYPTERALKNKIGLEIYSYPSDADGKIIEKILTELEAQQKTVGVIYMEAPGSHTFDIPDIEGIITLAQKRNIKTIIDNTWASHVRFKPIDYGMDIVIQATTKYEGGYGDTPSGVVITRTAEDYNILFKTAKFLGIGCVDLQTCRRLLKRIDSTQERMNQQNAAALQVIQWLERQDFVKEIICPFIKTSPFYERFQKYFKKGNGLFTVVFRDDIPEEKIKEFLNLCPLILKGQSWGGHVTLALQVHPQRQFTAVPSSEKVRYSIGLESPEDIIRSLDFAKSTFL